MSIIKDPTLAKSGKSKIKWVKNHMPVLAKVSKESIERQIFHGLKIGMSIHLEAKTAQLALTLRKAGAKVFATGCNPLSTQDDIAAALVDEGIGIFAINGIDDRGYHEHIYQVLKNRPNLIIDDGGDLLQTYISLNPNEKFPLIGGCEETTTGIHRLRELESSNHLPCPMMNINDANCKHLFDNHHGTGQSSLTEIMKMTNIEIAGKTFVVGGYGNCGSGIAKRARGMGAIVVVTEVDPVKALRANMDGFQVLPMKDAAPLGDFFVTATGAPNIIRKTHFKQMKNGAFLANAGHFNVEINLDDLKSIAKHHASLRPNIDTFFLENGKKLHLLAEGRLVNLANGDGHPADIMDMSFALQFLGLKYIVEHPELTAKLYDIPHKLDNLVAHAKLESLGLRIDN